MLLLLVAWMFGPVLFPDTGTSRWVPVRVTVEQTQIRLERVHPKKHPSLYAFPLIPDYAVFLQGSPGANGWMQEFTRLAREQALLAHIRCGFIPADSAVWVWPINAGDSLRATPYGLEQWNPFVFFSETPPGAGDSGALFQEYLWVYTRSASSIRHPAALWREEAWKVQDTFDYAFTLTPPRRVSVRFWVPRDLRGLPPFPGIPYFYRASLDHPYSFLRSEAFRQAHVRPPAYRNLRTRTAARFGSFAGFPDRWPGLAAWKTLEAWRNVLGDWEALKRIWPEHLAGLVLFDRNPFEIPDTAACTASVGVIQTRFPGPLVYPSIFTWLVDFLPPGTFAYGKPSVLIRRLSDSQNPWGFPQHAAFSSQWKRGFIQDSCVVDTGLSPATFWSAGAILTVGPADSGLDMRFRDTLILEGVSTTQPYRILLHSAATFRVDTFLVARAVRDTVLRVPLRGLWARNLWAMEIMPTRPASRASFCVRSVRVSDANPEKLARVLVDRAERMRNLADTTGLAKMVQLVENLPDPSPSLRYAAAYAAWRLIPLVEGRAQTTWIRKGLQFTRPDDPGELLALRYSLLGWLAGHSTWEAIRRGREMNRLARALENGGTPHGWLVLGVSKLFTPSMFGGNIDQAIDFLDRARKALVSCEEGTFACWGEDDAYAFLYQAYKKKQEHEKARKVLKEGVERHPESTYLWILYLEEVTGQ